MGAVISAAFSPDGQRIVTASARQNGPGLERGDWAAGGEAGRPYWSSSTAPRSLPTASASSPPA